MSSDLLIDFQDVSFRYFESPHGIDNISIQASAGDRILLIGHNGCGKSTLLTLLAGRRMASSKISTKVLGSDAFDDTSLNARVALIGPPWPPEAYFANTVMAIASPAPIPERRASIANALHLPLDAYVDKMSSGEKRRVQILHGMLNLSTVYLLDECSTDIDVAERQTVLQLIETECTTRGACCVYATHILDGTKGWATHVALMSEGRIVSFLPVGEIEDTLEVYAHKFMARKESKPFTSYLSTLSEHQENNATEADTTTIAAFSRQKQYHLEGTTMPVGVAYRTQDPDFGSAPAIQCRGLNYKHIFQNLSFEIARGSRTLLLGCNGCGKSTLLNMMGGKQFFVNDGKKLTILGRACYDDMKLNAQISFGGDWWKKPPGGQMHVREMIPCSPLSPRGEALVRVLDMNLDADVRHMSAGEQKRVQLLLHLLEDKPIVMLDEATSDLDVDQRHELLKFLYLESEVRGVTVVYTTHIFEGLKGWANGCIVLDRTTKKVHTVMQGEEVDLMKVTQILFQLKQGEAFSGAKQ